MDPNFDAEAFTLLGVGLGVIAFRFGSRLVTLGLRNLKPDDYLMLLVAVRFYKYITNGRKFGANDGFCRSCMLDIPSLHIMWACLETDLRMRQ